MLADAADALDWERRRWPALHQLLTRIHPSCPAAVDARQAGELAGAVEACGNVFLADQVAAERQALSAALQSMAADPQASPVARELAAAWEAGDDPAWDAAVAEVNRLWTIRPDAIRYAELADRLAAAAPEFSARVDSGVLPVQPGETVLRAWRWRQAQTWFDQTVGSVDTDALGREVERCRDRIRRLTHELVVTSAWLEVGVPADRVNALIAAHLSDVPSAAHFDTESSLYDHAVRRSPQWILLTEHFRCVPPIIEFSSTTYYDRKIQPLRADRPVGLGGSVNAVAVPDGRRTSLPDFGQVNVPEADALVARVVQMVADPAYRGRSFGVVSLLSSSGQAAYLLHRLRDEVGPEELERRALRVGDPYTFQGDERDVVLISTVVAKADGDLGAFTKRDFHRRVNVAASRARDQMWLFHSVDPGDLVADDARALLLTHCLQRHPVPDEDIPAEQQCESDMELAVLRRLVERGLRPTVQYPIGDFRIDFVLTAPDGRRLAVECDDGYRGAEAFARDLRRQAVLERVGNCVFVRLRASAFARDPEVAMQPVWQRVEQLNIPAVARPTSRPA